MSTRTSRTISARRFAERNVMEYWIGLPHQSALMFAARTTLPHFSVSSAMSLPKSAGGLGYLIQYGAQIFKMNIVMTGITILAIVSSLMYLAISWLEAAVMRRR